jgi:signal peptidase I
MSIYRNKEKLQPASKKNRGKANFYDLFFFLGILLTVISINALNAIERILLMASYFLIILPVLIKLGGTIGQFIVGLRVRRTDDFSKNISLPSAYYRYVLLLTHYLVGFLASQTKNKHLFETLSNSTTVEINFETQDESLKEEKTKRSRFNFILYSLIYVLWVIWLGNYWFLLGLIIIYDVTISEKINWTPWKKREGNNHWAIEWLDALIFAVVAVTIINIFLFQNYKIPTPSMEKSLLVGDHLYVSKVAYGPRIPQTPLAIPFMQHTIPGTESKSFVEWIKLPYKRLAGMTTIKRDDPVVFNFPEGDTVCKKIELQAQSYYSIVKSKADQLKMIDKYSRNPIKTDNEYLALGRKAVWNEQEILVRPVDKRDNYIKRCVGIPGDTLQIIDGVVYVNGTRQKEIPGIQYEFAVETGGRKLNEKKLMDMGINKKDIMYSPDLAYLQVPLSEEMATQLENNKLVSGLQPLIMSKEYSDSSLFPRDRRFKWNVDHYGPIYIPAKGATIEINLDNLPLYRRIIGYYEGNKLEVKDSTIFINEEASTRYTFKMDYYWMMGDNRHHSLDSRYWGYVPEDHIVGKPKFVWLSLNQDKNFPMNIRLQRMFMGIK